MQYDTEFLVHRIWMQVGGHIEHGLDHCPGLDSSVPAMAAIAVSARYAIIRTVSRASFLVGFSRTN